MSKCCPIIKMTVARQSAQFGMSVSGTAGGGSVTVADRLRSPRDIRLSGDALGAALFDGSEDAIIYTTVGRLTNTELEEILK